MFYRYEIINNGKEDILYLYLNMKYEFSKELIGNDFKDLSRRTKNFINSNNIKPSFNNKEYTIVENQELLINDENNQINNYKSNNENIKIQNNQLKIKSEIHPYLYQFDLL